MNNRLINTGAEASLEYVVGVQFYNYDSVSTIITIPAGVQENDLMIVIAHGTHYYGSTGWSYIKGDDDRGYGGVHILEKIAGASEPTTQYTIDLLGGGSSTWGVTLVVVRNAAIHVHNSPLIDIKLTYTSSGVMTTNSLTMTSGSVILVSTVIQANSNITIGPSGMTLIDEVDYGGFTGWGSVWYETEISGGSVSKSASFSVPAYGVMMIMEIQKAE